MLGRSAAAARGGCAAGARRWGARWLALAGVAASLSGGPRISLGASVTVDAKGTVHVQELIVPPSPLLSPAGRAYMAQHLKAAQRPPAGGDGDPELLKAYLVRDHALYPVRRRDTRIAGVHVLVFTPKGGVAARNRRRVLINLHGGAFSGCWPTCAELESVPIASVGGFRVISVDYREGPKYRFPAASEDVARVYRALLKSYRPQDVGIYGCSAGGLLTAMAAAWLESHGLPEPGAIGIFCAGGAAPGAPGFAGDSSYVGAALGEASAVPFIGRAGVGYMAGVNPESPLASPVDSSQVLARFPPTLLITASRDIAMSSAIYTHERLSQLGVATELHVWDGLNHGFFYDPDVPESRQCYRVIVRFFEHRLGSGSPNAVAPG